MKPIYKNILAVACGLIVGGLVNEGLIMMSSSFIPPPAGADVSTMEGLKKSMHLFQPRHFVMPFAAHALGTFVGAFLTSYLSANKKLMLSMLIGFMFLLGGISAVMMLPAPLWFNVLDLSCAYLPMSYLGYLLIKKIQG